MIVVNLCLFFEGTGRGVTGRAIFPAPVSTFVAKDFERIAVVSGDVPSIV